MLQNATQRRSRLVRHLAGALLLTTVLVLAWLQYRWLAQLRDEEAARRQVALAVASASFAETVSQRLRDLLDHLMQDDPTLADTPLAGELLSWAAPDRGDRVLRDGSWQPLGAAELQQRLGRRLVAQGRDAGAGLWLDPPALVNCGAQGCLAVLLDETAFDAWLGEIAARVLADFSEPLQVAVTVVGDDGQARRVLYPQEGPLRNLAVVDQAVVLADDLPTLGPPGRRWELRINQGGSSLQAVLARSHLRNVLLSASILALLGVGLALTVRTSRRQAALAEQQIYFVASASHELRTPLSVIASAADNLADGTVVEPERVARYGALVRGEARKLAAMIDNVLQFSESAYRSPELQRLRVADLADAALRACDASLAGYHLRVDIPTDLPEIDGDPSALRALLVNLLTNAAKYGEGERWIALSARTVAQRSGRAALAISVTNPVRSRLDADPEQWFEPFRRGRTALDAGIPGTGIGLAVARNIAQRHGGGLTVHVAPQRQVRLTLYLPVPE